MDLPFVDVVVPHLDDHHRLALCLADLAAQSYPADRFSVTVVDNGSSRPVEQSVLAPARARVLTEHRRGCGSARNHGVDDTAGTILAFTDSDCRPHPDWLLNGVKRLAEPGIDVVAGAIDVFAADEAAPTDAELFDKVFGFEARRYAERKHFATGANIMVSRRVFQVVGPFRDGTLPEDLDWGRRATRLGYRIVFCPEVKVRHPARRTMADLRKKAERTCWHSRNLMAEQPLFRLRWAIYTAAMASPPLIKLSQILASPALSGWTQRRRAARAMLRVRGWKVATMLRFLVAPVPRA
ncbi:glycosyltransferase family 2 protein [Magnetospirillum sp. UT-4]|uniref:glycosyltransferase n=1 Tax=Magnetospirillum sp. UT-4 TaxID=2681467 RepID=UPI0013863BBF|nr:glycosyltransferase [Magnetospirillum sp. UT-4]CAA7625483.1 Glycosyl transferase family 2 [Magnetospirillum sp. UT-4]